MSSSARPRKPQRPRAPRRRAADAPGDESAQRLQKVLAAAGVGSRRQCEELIESGRVEVDRQVVSRLGSKVDPLEQEIRVDGEVVSAPRRVYYLVHKPAGIISTNRDPSGRPRVTDLVPPEAGRLFSVGRLDMSSEGLILLTNDGELANRLTHPRYGVTKTYHVQVAGHPDRDDLSQLRRGVHLAEGIVRATEVRLKGRRKQGSVLEIVLAEGRNREIRRMLARLGHKVQRLKRVAVGPIRLGDVPAGAHRPLSRDEVRALRAAVADGSKGTDASKGTDGTKGRGSRRRSTARGAKGVTGSRPGGRAKSAADSADSAHRAGPRGKRRRPAAGKPRGAGQGRGRSA